MYHAIANMLSFWHIFRTLLLFLVFWQVFCIFWPGTTCKHLTTREIKKSPHIGEYLDFAEFRIGKIFAGYIKSCPDSKLLELQISQFFIAKYGRGDAIYTLFSTTSYLHIISGGLEKLFEPQQRKSIEFALTSLRHYDISRICFYHSPQFETYYLHFSTKLCPQKVPPYQ